MATPKDQLVTDVVIDRLVDGELSLEEELEILALLERAPSDWRRCALAFVEAQAWRRGISGREKCVFTENGEEAPVRGAKSGPSWRNNGLRRRFSPLALAASVLVALSAGLLMPRYGDLYGDGDSAGIASSMDASTSQVDLAAQQLPDPQSLTRSASDQASRTWPNMIDLSKVMAMQLQGADGSVRQVLVPLLDENDVSRLAGGLTEAGINSALPDGVRRQLENAGYRIERRRSYAPFTLDSGQRMIVPVEDTQIVPVRYTVH